MVIFLLSPLPSCCQYKSPFPAGAVRESKTSETTGRHWSGSCSPAEPRRQQLQPRHPHVPYLGTAVTAHWLCHSDGLLTHRCQRPGCVTVPLARQAPSHPPGQGSSGRKAINPSHSLITTHCLNPIYWVWQSATFAIYIQRQASIYSILSASAHPSLYLHLPH